MFEKAIKIILSEPPELHYPSYYADLLREKCSEIPNSSDLRQQAIDLLDEQIAICDRALTNPGISMNDEFAVKVEKRSLIAYREKLECLLPTQPKKHTDKRTETHAYDLIDRQAAISLAGDLQIHSDEYHMYNQAINNYCTEIMGLPSAQSAPCEGCKHLGKWDNEVECGVPSPCTFCKRSAEDNYER